MGNKLMQEDVGRGNASKSGDNATFSDKSLSAVDRPELSGQLVS